MTKILKKIIYEPLIHFLVLGFILYIYYAQTVVSSRVKINDIEISPSEKLQLEELYLKIWEQNITKEQLSLEINFQIYKKILFQEAYNLKLDKQDSEIQKRLLRKMEFILSNTEVFKEPTEDELYKYYIKNRDDYSHIEYLSLHYLSFDFKEDKKLLNILKIIETFEVTDLESQKEILNISLEKLKEKFGKYFVYKVENLKKNVWSKPINSKEGINLVYITDKKVSEMYDFNEVQDRVYKDYKQEVLKKTKLKAYKNLLQQYRVKY